ncbi:lamin tail domain-containing protein [Myxococcota bacterium]|nr:lamin tail domain-containing protein [Myxococcota bacterium]
MKIRILLSSVLALLLFTHCDDGGKKTDKCADVTCGDNATCNTGSGACECNTGFTGDPVAGCTAVSLCENVTCGDNATCDPNNGECACDDGYVGDPDTGCTLSALCDEVTCGANATCNPNNGECACDDGYIGDPDTGCTLAGTCEANTCTGHGTCDDAGGVVTCDCNTGYTGEFCGTCDTANGYVTDPENPGDCIQNPCTPDPCYGNGTCTVENNLPVCDCNTGYAGGNCNRCDTDNGYMDDPENAGECILDACFGYDCGNGTCALNGGTPTCTCSTGYTGAACDACDTASGYVASIAITGTCVLNPCLSQTCSNHGTCSQSDTDTAQCACATGYFGATCSTCDTANDYIASTLSPGTCIPTPCTAGACNSHGTCTVVSDAASCACATGWTGATCSTCATGYTGPLCDTCDTANGYVASTLVPGTCITDPCTGEDCNSHGTCAAVNDAPSCTCATGYTGTACDACDTANDFVASNATPGTCITDPCLSQTCSGHGTCSIDAADATVCACATGYTGALCAACDTANDYIASTEVPGTCIMNPCPAVGACSGNGSCLVVADAASCTCDTGFAGTLCASCDTANDYIASTEVPGTCIIDPCLTETCSGHGTCGVDADLAECTCNPGYIDDLCDACDTVNDYIEFPLGSGVCVENVVPQPGELVITEIMIQATTTPPSNGQWFEITNITDSTKRLANLSLIADFAQIDIPSDSPVTIPPHGSLLVGSNPISGTNGGLTFEQLIPGIDLSISSGTIEIARTSDGTSIDIVTWDSTWNHQAGRSLSLSPSALTNGLPPADLNDNGDHWCFGATSYGSMYGTPDAANDMCHLTWCGLQAPAATTTDEGVATELIYGQVYDALMTLGQDNFNPFITAQIGFGPVGTEVTDPGWTWTDAAYNTSFAGDVNNEEFEGSLVPTTAGTYDYVYRISSDGGLSHQYCYWYTDGTSSGELTVNAAAPKSLFFSEYYEGGSNNKALEIFNPLSTPYNLSGCSIGLYSVNTGVPPVTPTTTVTLSGTLNPNTTFVICNPSAVIPATGALIPAATCNLILGSSTNVANFNGDDTIELICGGVTIDVIGQIGFDPGTFWGVSPVSTLNNTLRRKCGISIGDAIGSDVFDPALQWDGFVQDTIDGLGSHTTCY